MAKSDRLKAFEKKHGPSKRTPGMVDFDEGKKVSGKRTSTYKAPNISKPLPRLGDAEKMDIGLPTSGTCPTCGKKK